MVSASSIFYCELRRDSAEIRDLLAEDDKMKKEFLDKCELILEMAEVAKKSGLLELEAYLELRDTKDSPVSPDLKRMTGMVVDGVDPAVIEDIQLKRYFSAGLSEFEGFMFLIYLDSVLMIQSAVPDFLMEESLKSYMPASLVKEFEKRISE